MVLQVSLKLCFHPKYPELLVPGTTVLFEELKGAFSPLLSAFPRDSCLYMSRLYNKLLHSSPVGGGNAEGHTALWHHIKWRTGNTATTVIMKEIQVVLLWFTALGSLSQFKSSGDFTSYCRKMTESMKSPEMKCCYSTDHKCAASPTPVLLESTPPPRAGGYGG